MRQDPKEAWEIPTRNQGWDSDLNQSRVPDFTLLSVQFHHFGSPLRASDLCDDTWYSRNIQRKNGAEQLLGGILANTQKYCDFEDSIILLLSVGGGTQNDGIALMGKLLLVRPLRLLKCYSRDNWSNSHSSDCLLLAIIPSHAEILSSDEHAPFSYFLRWSISGKPRSPKCIKRNRRGVLWWLYRCEFQRRFQVHRWIPHFPTGVCSHFRGLSRNGHLGKTINLGISNHNFNCSA